MSRPALLDADPTDPQEMHDSVTARQREHPAGGSGMIPLHTMEIKGTRIRSQEQTTVRQELGLGWQGSTDIPGLGQLAWQRHSTALNGAGRRTPARALLNRGEG